MRRIWCTHPYLYAVLMPSRRTVHFGCLLLFFLMRGFLPLKPLLPYPAGCFGAIDIARPLKLEISPLLIKEFRPSHFTTSEVGLP